MQCSRHPLAATTLILAALFAITGNISTLQTEESLKPDYTETIAVLQMLYGNEVRAGYRYQLYSDRAKADGHINIAHMFKAIAASEAVHAKNFKRILQSLNTEVHEIDLSSIKASGTKDNLKYATHVELSEIDNEYPRYIQRVGVESHAQAVEYINYAWEAERQHRELIKEIQSGTGFFFSVLLDRFREKESVYYVNQNCGATVHELPVDACPICHKPLDTYMEIPKP
ncbi:rubrerythrin [Mariprofundus sp. NF]|uniref:rubrerythrin family protein n=1 Tax=Mariprofundus sp. NF TaxID=2608716 RepID=UPI0015A21276|nr:rubrerythrin family protein [Mariprofundus sp. NF]NWF39295.1 rubrerythrin [Mariprofundus sp. NF]